MGRPYQGGAYKTTSKGREYWYAWKPQKGEKAPRLLAPPRTPEFYKELNEKLAQRRLRRAKAPKERVRSEASIIDRLVEALTMMQHDLRAIRQQVEMMARKR